VCRVVDHQRDLGSRVLVSGQVAQRAAVNRGITHHHVVGDTLAHQPERLAQRVAEHPCEAGERECSLHQGRDPQ
jgi:hypothetical protein